MYGYDYSYYSPAKYYGDDPCFLHRDRLPNQGFRSVYFVTKEGAEAIKQAGTTQGFAGIVHSERLDVDTDDYEKAERVERILIEKGLDYYAFDSGGRGGHFSIAREAVPSHLLPYQDRAWVQAHLPGADVSIYTHMHLFRLPGTLHETTGERKTLLSEARGSSIKLAKYEFPKRTYKPTYSRDTSLLSIFDNLRVMSSTVPQQNGNRHPTLVKLAYALKDANVGEHEARWWLGETNKMFAEPKEESELDGIMERIYK